ncbi:MAG: adenosylcobinamide-GDP ribazoletransferase, partial [Bacteroides oleiciplenus]|nr:adenosylcobinamide-GDP ribazoletransferase [Bacteroides oleiciplenus]
VIGLIIYFLLMFLLLKNLPLQLICALVICGDCYSKFCASQIINSLPYARKEEDSKAKVIYDRMTWQESLTGFVCGLLPIVLFLPIIFWPVICLPLITFVALCRLMKRRLQGYTGDCCGAMFLLCELSFYLGAAILAYTHSRYGNPDLINTYFNNI